MSETYKAFELCVEEAIQAFYNGDFASAAAAVKAHGIHSYCLQKHLKGQALKFTHSSINRVLTNEQAQSICDYIEHLNSVNMSFTVKLLKGAADYLLTETHNDSSSSLTVGCY